MSGLKNKKDKGIHHLSQALLYECSELQSNKGVKSATKRDLIYIRLDVEYSEKVAKIIIMYFILMILVKKQGSM